MSETFELEIVRHLSSEKIPIRWVKCESPNGHFLIGIDHSPLVSLLKKQGVLVYEDLDQEQKSINVTGGILFVADNKVTIILD